jgi:hypothetical protein
MTDIHSAFTMITAAMRDAEERHQRPSLTLAEFSPPYMNGHRWVCNISSDQGRRRITCTGRTLSDAVIAAALELQRQDGDL